MKPLILVPAYGRKYQTEEAAIKDYQDGKDFKVMYGAYCSCRDFPNESVNIYMGDGLYITTIKSLTS